MCAKDSYTSFTVVVRNGDTVLRNRLRSYPEVVKYLLKNFTTDQAIAKLDAVILRHKQPLNMAVQ